MNQPVPAPDRPARSGLRGRVLRTAASLLPALFALAVTITAPAQAQGPGKPVAEQGARWGDLKSGQKEALRPLEREWSGIDPRSKQKWLQLSARFPGMTPPEQARVQERMSAWTRLTPRERGEARLQFQEARQVPAQDRQARWKTYEALSPEQKQQLAARAVPAGTDAKQSRPLRDERAAPQLKSNIVPNPAYAIVPRPVAPTVVQARPGATTTLITRRPAPPGHQQAGMPKIAATPEFVDKATLLPQRGPQGAATRGAAPAAPGAAPRP